MMTEIKFLALLSVLLIAQFCFGQGSIDTYLKSSVQDLTKDFSLQIDEVKMIGFGALHGSAKTEDTEVLLLQKLIENHNLKYYLPETDFSTANYFQRFIETGDEQLLQDLILEYGTMIPQEKSIEVFEKWKKIRPLFLKNGVRVIGVDRIASYKYSIKQLLEITEDNDKWIYRDSLEMVIKKPETDWSVFENLKLKQFIQNFVEDYEINKATYSPFIRDKFSFNHIIRNFEYTYESYRREPFIFENYVAMNEQYLLEKSLHFARFGIFHIMKSRINNGSPFFTMLLEKGIYSPSEVITMQGFLTKSRVMWNKYDRDGNKKRYTTKKGYGIGDYWLEYFYKIKDLKKNKVSDITLFRLNAEDSPYNREKELRLIRIKKLLGNTGWDPEKDKSTLDYIDYAILISHSSANKPLQELR